MQHSGGNRGNLECQPLVQPKGECLEKQPSTRALGVLLTEARRPAARRCGRAH